nr:helix-hairpin-helix domain-containing protein [Clostridium sp. BJN0001]
MLDKIIKEKNKIGIITLVTILIIVTFFIYHKSGYKELSKNNTESIFEEESEMNAKNESKKDTALENDFDNNDKNTITVEIKGEVKKPDVYKMGDDSIVRDLIEKAGGTTDNANIKNINRAKKLNDHEVIYIQNNEEAEKGKPVFNSESSTSTDSSSESSKININTADAEGLKKINGVGDAKAKKIIEYREKNGKFKSIDEIKNIGGIGEKTFEKMKSQLET